MQSWYIALVPVCNSSYNMICPSPSENSSPFNQGSPYYQNFYRWIFLQVQPVNIEEAARIRGVICKHLETHLETQVQRCDAMSYLPCPIMTLTIDNN